MKAHGRSLDVPFIGGAKTVGASATNTQVGENFGLQGGGRIRIDILIDSSTETNDIDFTLQVSPGPGTDGVLLWYPTKSVDGGGTTVAPGKWVTLTLQPEVAGDQPYLPVPGLGRIVCTTAVDDTVTVSRIRVWEAG